MVNILDAEIVTLATSLIGSVFNGELFLFLKRDFRGLSEYLNKTQYIRRVPGNE